MAMMLAMVGLMGTVAVQQTLLTATANAQDGAIALRLAGQAMEEFNSRVVQPGSPAIDRMAAVATGAVEQPGVPGCHRAGRPPPQSATSRWRRRIRVIDLGAEPALQHLGRGPVCAGHRQSQDDPAGSGEGEVTARTPRRRRARCRPDPGRADDHPGGGLGGGQLHLRVLRRPAAHLRDPDQAAERAAEPVDGHGGDDPAAARLGHRHGRLRPARASGQRGRAGHRHPSLQGGHAACSASRPSTSTTGRPARPISSTFSFFTNASGNFFDGTLTDTIETTYNGSNIKSDDARACSARASSSCCSTPSANPPGGDRGCSCSRSPPSRQHHLHTSQLALELQRARTRPGSCPTTTGRPTPASATWAR